MGIYESIKDFGKKALLLGVSVLIFGGCSEKERWYYIDLDGDSEKEAVFLKYEGSGSPLKNWYGNPALGLYEGRENSRKLITLEGVIRNLRFEDLDSDGFPEIVFERCAMRKFFDDACGVYFAKNNNGEFGEPERLSRVDK